MTTRKKQIDSTEKLKIHEQCNILSLPRSSYYYQGKTKFNNQETAAMLLIQDIYSDCPFYGHRRIYKDLQESEIKIGRDL